MVWPKLSWRFSHCRVGWSLAAHVASHEKRGECPQRSSFAFLNTWLLSFYRTRDSNTYHQHVTAHHIVAEVDCISKLSTTEFDRVFSSGRRGQAGEDLAGLLCQSSRVFYLPGCEKLVLGLDETFYVVTTMTKLELWEWVCARLQRDYVKGKNSSGFLTQHSCHPLNLTNLINWQTPSSRSSEHTRLSSKEVFVQNRSCLERSFVCFLGTLLWASEVFVQQVWPGKVYHFESLPY